MQIWTAFILGLIGSVHCAGMCGPLSIALPGDPRKNRFLFGRVAYNSGRVFTYSLLGVVFGLLGKSLFLAGLQRWFSIILGIVLLAGLFIKGRALAVRFISAWVDRIKTSMGSLLRRRSITASFAFGACNGLLPCGLVYVACAASAAVGSVPGGIAYMAAFGLGTFPMMLALSLSGRMFPFKFRLRLQRLIPASVCVIAFLLILRGMALGIPYVSPDLASGHSCCTP